MYKCHLFCPLPFPLCFSHVGISLCWHICIILFWFVLFWYL
jgi:hypothetical protein